MTKYLCQVITKFIVVLRENNRNTSYWYKKFDKEFRKCNNLI